MGPLGDQMASSTLHPHLKAGVSDGGTGSAITCLAVPDGEQYIFVE